MHYNILRTTFVSMMVAVATPAEIDADEWANLTGRFVFPPELARDAEVLDDKQLRINPKNNGLANVFVWIHRQQKGPV